MKRNILWSHHRSNAEMARLYLSARANSLLRPGRFRDVRFYCMFIGYPRSGHSLVGSLLDAHPNVVIAQECDVLKFIRMGFGRSAIYQTLLLNSRTILSQRGREWSGYSYRVPGQWQGCYEKLLVIGDKKAGRSTDRLMRNPVLLPKLQTTVRVPIRVIHVVRNPYDNITTIARASKKSLEEAIDFYFSLCRTVVDLTSRIPVQGVCEVHLESLIADPKTTLRDLCGFLGVSAGDDYLESCATIVYDSPNKTRSKLKWTSQMINLVRSQSQKIPFLSRHTFES